MNLGGNTEGKAFVLFAGTKAFVFVPEYDAGSKGYTFRVRMKKHNFGIRAL